MLETTGRWSSRRPGAWPRLLRIAPASLMGLVVPLAVGLPRGAEATVQAALVVAAAAATAAVVLPLRWLLYAVIVAIPFDNFAVPVGPLRISASDGLLVAVTLRWAVGVAFRGGRLARSELYGPAAVFYALLLPSFFVTFDLGISTRHAFSIAMMLLTAVVTANLLRAERDLKGVVNAALAASLVMSVLALVQLVFWMRYRMSPLQPITDVVRLGGFTLPRVTGTYFDPNYLALYLVVPIILGLFVALDGKLSRRHAWFVWSVIALDLAVFVMTFSRGGWVTLLAFMGAYVVLRGRPMRLIWLAMVTLMAMAAPLVAAVLVGINPQSVANRLHLLGLGLEVMARHPLAGTGLGTFMLLPENVMGKLAHSTYIQIGADAGVPALAAFLALMVVVAANAAGALRAAPAGMTRAVLAGCLFALGAVAVQAGFLNALVLKHVWVLVGLTSAAAAVARAQAGSPAPALASQAQPG